MLSGPIFGPVKTTTLLRTAGAPARTPRLEQLLQIIVLTVLLALAPMLVRNAMAQRPASIRASAFVTTSIIAVALRPDSAGVAADLPLRPGAERLLIAGIGMLDVLAGPGEAIRVAPMPEDALHQNRIVVQVFNVGS
jgi:hypothetical protein